MSDECPNFSISNSTSSVSGFHLPALNTTGILGVTFFFTVVFDEVSGATSRYSSLPSAFFFLRWEGIGADSIDEEGALRFLPKMIGSF